MRNELLCITQLDGSLYTQIHCKKLLETLTTKMFWTAKNVQNIECSTAFKLASKEVDLSRPTET
jgi:hypothetical protein